MATVNLSWTAPSSVSDVDNIEIYRWAGLSASATADLETLITAGATALTTVSNSVPQVYSDAAAPAPAVLTYAAVSRNTAGYKLEGTGHADVTTT
jgi:hypothetical protein